MPISLVTFLFGNKKVTSAIGVINSNLRSFTFLRKSVMLYYYEKEAAATKARKLTLMAMLTAIALTIFMIEAQIPALVPIPGIKLGLANIVTVFAVFALGSGEAASILFVRIFLGAVFAGNFSTVLYSGAGGLCAILIAIGLRKILTHRQLWVAGALSAIGHSVGQMAMAIAITATPSLAIYLPVMILCSVITGLFTGLCAQFVLNRGNKIWKTFLK